MVPLEFVVTMPQYGGTPSVVEGGVELYEFHCIFYIGKVWTMNVFIGEFIVFI